MNTNVVEVLFGFLFVGFLGYFLAFFNWWENKDGRVTAQYDSQHPMHWKILILNNLDEGCVYISDDIRFKITDLDAIFQGLMSQDRKEMRIHNLSPL